jgi:hypothetical protein
MSVAFLTEMEFTGKIPVDHPNMRTEFAWMHALDAVHIPIRQFNQVRDHDHVFIIFPKGRVYLSAEGSKIIDQSNPVSDLIHSDIVDILKASNRKVYYVQEGPHWWFNNYELADQIGFFNLLASCDAIFCHNSSDAPYYKGLFPNKPVRVIPSLMIEHSIIGIKAKPEDKAIIGGNFSRWYGGFESYSVAQEFNVPVWGQTSHATREGEDQLIQQLPRVMWTEWMKQLSTFKYAVHLMPTVAAGTFSLNCAYLGIPCIGNREVDTQVRCHPHLSVDVEDIEQARKLASRLAADKDFYDDCSQSAKKLYKQYYSLENFKEKFFIMIGIK